MSLYMVKPSLTTARYVRWSPYYREYYCDYGEWGIGRPEMPVIAQDLKIYGVQSDGWSDSHGFRPDHRVFQKLPPYDAYPYDGSSGFSTPACNFTPLALSGVPTWTERTQWRIWISPDYSFTVAAVWCLTDGLYPPDPLRIDVASTGVWTNTGIYMNDSGTDPEMYLESTSAVWIFLPYTNGSGGESYEYGIWNGSSLSTIVQLSALLPTATDKASNLHFVKGPGTTVYLLYEVGTLAQVRSIDTVTKVLSSVLHSFTIAGFGYRLEGWGRAIADNKVYTFGTDNYFCGWYSSGEAAVYRYATATPNTITAITGTGLSNSKYSAMSIEYDPSSTSIYMVHWTLQSGTYPSLLNSSELAIVSVPMKGATWSTESNITQILALNQYDPAYGLLTVASSQEGENAETVVLFHTRTDALYPGLVIARLKTWAPDVGSTRDGEVSIPLDSSFNFSVETAGSISASCLIDPTLTVSVDARVRATSHVYSRWDLVANVWTDAAVLIDLTASMDVTVELTLIGYTDITVLCDELDYSNVTITADILIESTLTVQYMQMGTTWMSEFMVLVNALRASQGLTALHTFGTDALSIKRFNQYDVAHRHANNEATTRILAHNSSAFPSGWQQLTTRIAKVAIAGAENLQEAQYFSYQYGTFYDHTPLAAYTGWFNSPNHYANMVRDWSYYETTGAVYSDLGFDYGAPSTNVSGQSPTSWMDLYLVNKFLVLEESYVELSYGQYWEFNGATISIIDQLWNNVAYTPAAAAMETDYSLKVSAEHTASYSCRAAAQHEAIVYYGVSAAVEATYTASYPTVATSIESFYDIRKEVVSASHQADWTATVSQSLSSEYGIYPTVQASMVSLYESTPTVQAIMEALYESSPRATSSLESTYGSVPRVLAEMEAVYGSAARSTASNEALYSETLRAKASSEAPYAASVKSYTSMETTYGDNLRVQVEMATSYSLRRKVNAFCISSAFLTERTHGVCTASYDLLLRNPAKGYSLAPYQLAEASAAVASSVVTMVHKGMTYRISDGYITASEGSSFYTFNAKIENVAVYLDITELDAITVDFAGEVYQFVIIGRTLSRSSPGNIDLSLTAVSPLALLDLPYSAQISYTAPISDNISVSVSTILGSSIAWEVPDWIVPFGRIQVAAATPLGAANSLLGCIKASIQSEPNGDLRAVYTYPVSFDKLKSISPDVLLNEGSSIFTVSSSYEYRSGYNRFTIRDSDPSYADNLSWEADPDNTRTGILTVTPYPYRASWVLATTSPSGISIDALGETTELVTDTVEFKQGTGSLSKPIIELVSCVWVSTPLGGVSFDPYSSTLSTSSAINFGYGLAIVEYNSKAYTFRVTADSGVDWSQFIVEEI